MSSDELHNYLYSNKIISSENEDGDLSERIFSCDTYSLSTISLTDLDPDEWAVDDYKVAEYLNLDIALMPPIVVHLYKNGSYSIVDGTHRVNVALKQKKTTILAYVGQKSY